jgi:hypothetical protein
VSYLELKIRENCEEPYVEFHVDGQDLGAVLMAAFGEAGFDDVLPWNGGDYAIAETVLGAQVRKNGAASAILFACGCGYYACSVVTTDVTVDQETIAFSRFATPSRGGLAVAPLEPIVFDRRQFEEAVAALERAVAAWRSTPRPVVPPKPVIELPPAPRDES